MNPKDYVKGALRTMAPTEPAFGRITADSKMLQLVHAVFGLATETGELFDQLKRHLFYGKPLDKVNLSEEVGDLMWYVALVCDYLGIDLETIMAQNNAKLRARFPDKFTEEAALNRDLDNERTIIEQY